MLEPRVGVAAAKSTRIRRSGLARDRKVAERMAGELEAQLKTGKAVIPARFLREDFRSRYEAEVVPGLAARTGEKITSVFDRFQKEINPRRLWDVDEKRLSAFVSELRKGQGEEGKGKLAESTIVGPRPAAGLRRALGCQADARPADGADAARDDRNDPLLLRGPQRRKDHRHPLARAREGNGAGRGNGGEESAGEAWQNERVRG